MDGAGEKVSYDNAAGATGSVSPSRGIGYPCICLCICVPRAREENVRRGPCVPSSAALPRALTTV